MKLWSYTERCSLCGTGLNMLIGIVAIGLHPVKYKSGIL